MLRIFILMGFLLVSAAGISLAADSIPVYQADVINTYPHDPNAFTQGLTIHEGSLYEGTGRNGQSSLRQVDLESGEVIRRSNLSSRYFGEGITVFNDRVYQLTWQSHTVFIYDLETFQVTDSFYLPGEGWGITHDGEHLIISDGTASLRFFDPATNTRVRTLSVSDNMGPVDRLNELEYINGEIWANVWYEDYIVRIDPQTGRIKSRVDLSDLGGRRGSEDVLNGIAWDSDNQRLFVTGKLWTRLYEIDVLD